MKQNFFGYLIIVIFTIVQIVLLTKNLWYDELFTTPLILGYDSVGIVDQLKYDAHPPFYYILLKFFSNIIGSSIISLKSFNVFVVAILAVIMYIFSKKLINKDYALIVTVLFCFFPTVYNEVFQLRMYIIAPFFVTLTAIFAYYSYTLPENTKNHIWLLLFTISSIYTHYYALVGVVFIHVVLYISLIIRSRAQIKLIVLLATVSLISFIPWIPTFLKQVVLKSQNIGDNSSAFDRIIKSMLYPFYTGNYAVRDIKLNYVLSAILLLIFLFVLFTYFYSIYKKRIQKDKGLYNLMIISMSISFLIPFIFILYSIVFTPIWFSRYFIIFFPMFILSFAYMLYCLKPITKYVVIAVILLISIQKIYSTYEITSDKGMQKFATLIENEIKPEDIILDGEIYTSTYFSKNKQYNLKENEANNWHRHIYWNVELVPNYNDVIKDKTYFWSTKLVSDSTYTIGKTKYQITESYNYKYKYFNVGEIGIYKYSKIPSE